MHRARLFLLAAVLTTLGSSRAVAQAWAYPAFQPPRVVSREFNFAVADARGGGTSLVFQWREGTGPKNQLSLDVGLADPDYRGADAMFFVGGQFAHQLATADADMPLDFLFTIGAYLAAGDFTFFRMPVGVSAGHRFALGGGTAITPFVHPRISVDVCSDCADESDLSVDFDLGMSLELTRSLSIRAMALLTGSDRFDDGWGVSVAWTPPGLARLRRR